MSTAKKKKSYAPGAWLEAETEKSLDSLVEAGVLKSSLRMRSPMRQTRGGNVYAKRAKDADTVDFQCVTKAGKTALIECKHISRDSLPMMSKKGLKREQFNALAYDKSFSFALLLVQVSHRGRVYLLDREAVANWPETEGETRKSMSLKYMEENSFFWGLVSVFSIPAYFFWGGHK